jgi:hypothetical protein
MRPKWPSIRAVEVLCLRKIVLILAVCEYH